MVSKRLVVMRIIVVQAVDNEKFAFTEFRKLFAVSSDKWPQDFVLVESHVVCVPLLLLLYLMPFRKSAT